MRRRRITFCENFAANWVEEPFSFCTLQLKLCLCEALYLPALRATSFQKEAKRMRSAHLFVKIARSAA